MNDGGRKGLIKDSFELPFSDFNQSGQMSIILIAKLVASIFPCMQKKSEWAFVSQAYAESIYKRFFFYGEWDYN
jgi:hypothetical protein